MKRFVLIVVELLLGSPAVGQVYRYELENGTRVGTNVSNAASGYSGTGYVTGFDSSNGSDYVQLQVDVPDGQKRHA